MMIEYQKFFGRILRKESKVHKSGHARMCILYITTENPPVVYAPQEARGHSFY